VDAIFEKHTLSKTKIINRAGMIHSSYYRVPSLGKKGNKASLYTHHKNKEWVTQDAVIESFKKVLVH